MTTLLKVKNAMKIRTDAFDDEITDLIEEAKADLQLVGITGADDETDVNIRAYIINYCKAHHGQPENYDQLTKWLETRKRQLKHKTGYTDWGDA